jgi:hypothetical protein
MYYVLNVTEILLQVTEKQRTEYVPEEFISSLEWNMM